MMTILVLFLSAGGDLEPVRWQELVLTIRRDPDVSSDSATICRVRVQNDGRGTWPGRRLTFEARAFSAGRVVERQRGRFGLVLGPHETLETVIAFLGVYDRFEVSPVEKGIDGGRANRRHRGNPRHRTRKR